MVRLSINSINVGNPSGETRCVEIKGLILEEKLGDLNNLLTNTKDIILTTDSEQRMIELLKGRRKSNPLMLNFEEYE